MNTPPVQSTMTNDKETIQDIINQIEVSQICTEKKQK